MAEKSRLTPSPHTPAESPQHSTPAQSTPWKSWDFLRHKSPAAVRHILLSVRSPSLPAGGARFLSPPPNDHALSGTPGNIRPAGRPIPCPDGRQDPVPATHHHNRDGILHPPAPVFSVRKAYTTSPTPSVRLFAPAPVSAS